MSSLKTLKDLEKKHWTTKDIESDIVETIEVTCTKCWQPVFLFHDGSLCVDQVRSLCNCKTPVTVDVR